MVGRVNFCAPLTSNFPKCGIHGIGLNKGQWRPYLQPILQNLYEIFLTSKALNFRGFIRQDYKIYIINNQSMLLYVILFYT